MFVKRWTGLLLLCWSLIGMADDGALSQVMRALAAVPAVEAAFREEKTLAMLDALMAQEPAGP